MPSTIPASLTILFRKLVSEEFASRFSITWTKTNSCVLIYKNNPGQCMQILCNKSVFRYNVTLDTQEGYPKILWEDVFYKQNIATPFKFKGTKTLFRRVTYPEMNPMLFKPVTNPVMNPSNGKVQKMNNLVRQAVSRIETQLITSTAHSRSAPPCDVKLSEEKKMTNFVDELVNLKALLDKGVISKPGYEKAKACVCTRAKAKASASS